MSAAVVSVFTRTENGGVVRSNNVPWDSDFTDNSLWDTFGISYLLVELDSIAFNCFNASEFKSMIDDPKNVAVIQAARACGIMRAVPKEFDNVNTNNILVDEFGEPIVEGGNDGN